VDFLATLSDMTRFISYVCDNTCDTLSWHKSGRGWRYFHQENAVSLHRRNETVLENAEILLPPEIANLLRAG
jgi:hypothetical protein